jgi:hypothetical protein
MKAPSQPAPVRDRVGMISGMAPVLQPAVVVFCTVTNAAQAGQAAVRALGQFHEAEGLSLILPLDVAREFGFPTDQPMAHITLTVNSALDGVGLTAAVATALADAAIPCNMVAAFHHDHVFVPAALAEAALDVLRALEEGARG